MIKKSCIYAVLLTVATSAFAKGSASEDPKNISSEIVPGAIAAGPADFLIDCAACQEVDSKHEHAFIVSRENNKKIYLSVISEVEANAAFSQIVSRGDIPFDYLKDGCYSRAHKMALLLDDKGIISGKVFVEGKIYYDTSMQGEVGWSYQVSPVVLVKKGEKIIPYVIEPSLFDKPVPVGDWMSVLTKKSKTEITRKYYTNRFSYDPNDRNSSYSDYREDQLNDMDDTNRNLARKLYVLKAMKERKNNK